MIIDIIYAIITLLALFLSLEPLFIPGEPIS